MPDEVRRAARPPASLVAGLAVVVLIVAALLVWMVTSGGETPQQRAERELAEPAAPLPSGEPPPLAAAGRAVYERRCTDCHGARLGGSPGVPDMRARRYTPPRWLDQDLANVIYAGRPGGAAGKPGPMPAFADELSSGEIAALVAYIRWEQGLEFGEPATAPETAGGVEVRS